MHFSSCTACRSIKESVLGRYPSFHSLEYQFSIQKFLYMPCFLLMQLSKERVAPMSYPARTAFFCSSMVIFCKSDILRLIFLIAWVWSMDWICRLTVTASSRSRSSASQTGLSAPGLKSVRKTLPRNGRPPGRSFHPWKTTCRRAR